MYQYKRLIPILGIINEDLINTQRFKEDRYLGDPINAVKIFNEKRVDELAIVDIRATVNNSEIQFNFIEKIANQAFMPLSYGGGIKSLDDVKKIFKMGFEKVIVNTLYFYNKPLIKEILNYAGTQSVVLSLDIRKSFFQNYALYSHSGQKKEAMLNDEVLNEINDFNFGEVIINNIDNDGLMNGYDLELISFINNKLTMPIIPYGGAGSIQHIDDLFEKKNISAAAATSLFVYQGNSKAVLISYPEQRKNHYRLD